MIWQVQSIITCIALCTPRLPNCFKVKKKSELLFGFLPVAILISNRFQCVMSQIYNLLFLSRGLIPWELWRIKSLASYFFAHCVIMNLSLCNHKSMLVSLLPCFDWNVCSALYFCTNKPKCDSRIVLAKNWSIII